MMEIIRVTLAGRNITVSPSPLLVEGLQNVIFVQFVFDVSWDGLSITAVFQNNQNAPEFREMKVIVPDATKLVEVPWEMFQQVGELSVGVFGVSGISGEDVVVNPTPYKLIAKIVNSVNMNANVPTPPPSNIYNDVLDLATRADDIAQSVRDDADAGMFDGDQGIQGIQGVPGKQGIQGVQGIQGSPFAIKKVYASVIAMNDDFNNPEVKLNDMVMITTMDVEMADNAKVFQKLETHFNFIVDLSGATGSQGTQGIQGISGVQGKQGIQGLQGIQGVSPHVEVKTETSTEYILSISDQRGTFETPNLKGRDGIGGGNMEKNVYDKNDNGKVDVSEYSDNSNLLQGHTLADILPKQMVLEIDTTNWVGTVQPFTKEIPIAAITAEDTPIIGLVTPKVTAGNVDMVRDLHIAYGVMTIWETFDGKIVVTCLEKKPEIAITVQLDFAGARNLTTRAYGASGGGELVLGISADTAYRGDRGHIAYEHSNSGDNPHNVTAQMIGAIDITNEIQPEEVAGAFDP